MKPKVINPNETTRLEAFELWMSAPNPMVTFFKQINVTNLVRISQKYKMKFNMPQNALHFAAYFYQLKKRLVFNKPLQNLFN